MIYCGTCIDCYELPLGRYLGNGYRRCEICEEERQYCQENTLLELGPDRPGKDRYAFVNYKAFFKKHQPEDFN